MASRTPFGSSGGPARDGWSGGRTPMAAGDSSRTPAWGGMNSSRSMYFPSKLRPKRLTITQHLLGVESVAPALQLGRTTVLALQTPTQRATAPLMAESATAHPPGTPPPRHPTIPVLASMPSPPAPALPPGAQQTLTQVTVPQPGAVPPIAMTSATSMMLQHPVGTTLLPRLAHMQPRLPAPQPPVAGLRVLPRLVLSTLRPQVAQRLRHTTHPLRLWVARWLRLVFMVVMTVALDMPTALVRNLGISSFF